MKSLREAAYYVVKHPNAFWLYALLLGGYIFVSFFLVLLGYPFNWIPLIGPVLSFPYQIISSAFQTYIGLSIIATLFAYYYSSEIPREIPGEPVVESPTPWAWRLWLAAVGALVMTTWDLAMDPMMAAGKHWIWEVEGAYFGIPLQNFWGWWLTIFVTFMLFLVLGKVTNKFEPTTDQRGNDFSRYDRLAIISYTLTILSSVAIDLRYGLAGAGMVGLFAMLPWILLSWQERNQ